MSDPLSRLLKEVQQARETFLASLHGITPDQASFKPAPDVWSIVEIVEHITLAEQVGVGGIWKALEAHQSGESLWTGELRDSSGRPFEPRPGNSLHC